MILGPSCRFWERCWIAEDRWKMSFSPLQFCLSYALVIVNWKRLFLECVLDYISWVLLCRVWFCRSGMGCGICTFNSLLGDADKVNDHALSTSELDSMQKLQLWFPNLDAYTGRITQGAYKKHPLATFSDMMI